MDIALGETTYKYLSQLHSDNTFEQHSVHLKGYDTPTITYASTFAGLNDFLERVGGSKP
jgi:adenylate cyclase